jgi:hypothetical protein
MKVGGSRIVEKNKSRKKKHVEYPAISYKVTVAFIIIFGMCRREGE